MFDTVLVANRGEIAVRIIATLRRLGIRSAAVFSDPDAAAAHVAAADVAVRLGAGPAHESYLNIGRVLDAARAVGAAAIHPGYGFLAENAGFAGACAEAGIVFIGPSPAAIQVMGDKIQAKLAVGRAGVPVIPGRAEPAMSDHDLMAAAIEVGFPVLVKPSAGGGGKGMQQVDVPEDLPGALGRARREAAASFGDDTLFVERLVSRPRHIEVQVLADTHGSTLHLGERECSLQRRHQKIIEEAPSVFVDAPTRARIGALAAATAEAVGYSGVGTVEFIVSADRPDEYFFMEMNTRLQVEHPVTEAITGLDLVEQQLRVAAGESLGFAQGDVRLGGHAIEARLYAEDPARGFLPTGGRVLALRHPSGEGIRVDTSLTKGLNVATTYDPMLCKIIAWAPTRGEALARLERALDATVLLGFNTNLRFLQTLLAHPEVRAGRLDTELIEREMERLSANEPSAAAYAAYGLYRLTSRWPVGGIVDPWDVPNGWRVGRAEPLTFSVATPAGGVVQVSVRGTPAQAWVRIGDDGEVPCSFVAADDGWLLTVAGTTRSVVAAEDHDTLWVAVDGGGWGLVEAPPLRRGGSVAAPDTEIRSPMPGAVLAIGVKEGDLVEAGMSIVTIEAMKMEHSLLAPSDGTIELLVGVGDQVKLEQVVARVRP